jgi:hypothetical protein
MRAARFYFEGGVQTRGDNFIYEDLTSSELIGRALGFNSAELFAAKTAALRWCVLAKGSKKSAPSL